MFRAELFVLLFAIIAIYKVQSDCNSDACSGVCETMDMSGTCNEDNCDCLSDKGCSIVACGAYCKLFNLHSECNDDGQCICKAPLDPCSPSHCMQQCHKDPHCRIAIPTACVKYGPVRVCFCHCIRKNFKYLQPNYRKNTFNLFERYNYGIKSLSNDI